MEKKGIKILGCGFDKHSTFLKGCAKAPMLIRKALFSDSMNLWTENGKLLDFTKEIKIEEDLELNNLEDPISVIESQVLLILNDQMIPVLIGGDHSITYPAVKAVAPTFEYLNILHFDAHPDLYDKYQDNPYSHACPFARIMENNLCQRLVQVGIRTFNDHQKKQAKKYKVESIELKNMKSDLKLKFEGPLYISLDMDVFEPGLVPGISHYEPGGMTVREVINIIQNLQCDQIVGADLVEYNPSRDINDMTAFVAAKLLKEIIGKILEVNQ